MIKAEEARKIALSTGIVNNMLKDIEEKINESAEQGKMTAVVQHWIFDHPERCGHEYDPEVMHRIVESLKSFGYYVEYTFADDNYQRGEIRVFFEEGCEEKHGKEKA